MRKTVCLALGLLPFGAGFGMNQWILSHPETPVPYQGIGFAMLISWAIVGFTLCNKTISPLEAALRLNFLGFLVLLALFVQTGSGAFWGNGLGIATQLFFLPVLNIAVTLLPSARQLSVLYAGCFVLLLLFSFAGARTRRRRDTRFAHLFPEE